MAEIKICPFQSFGAREQHEVCAREGCTLWIPIPGREEKGMCSFRFMAIMLGSIEPHLNTIAAKTK